VEFKGKGRMRKPFSKTKRFRLVNYGKLKNHLRKLSVPREFDKLIGYKGGKFPATISRKRAERLVEFAKKYNYKGNLFYATNPKVDISKLNPAEMKTFQKAVNQPLSVNAILKYIDVPKPRDGHILAVTRRDMLRFAQAAKGNQRDLNFVYRLINTSPHGLRGVSREEIARLIDIARRHKVDIEWLHEVPHDVLKELHRTSNNLRALSTTKNSRGLAGKVYRFAEGVLGFLRVTKLWGLSTMQANWLGNTIFAAQGGFTFNPNNFATLFEYAKHLGFLKASAGGAIVGASVAGTYDVLSDKDLTWEEYLLSMAAGMGLGSAGTAFGHLLGDSFQRRMKIPFKEYYRRLEAEGVIGNSQAALYAKEVVTGADVVDVNKLYKPAMRADGKPVMDHVKGGVALGARAIQYFADDVQRMMFHYDAIVNRGFTWDEATKAVKEVFGDFSQIKMTREERFVSKFFWFYRFQKWNAVRQVSLLASDPRWAAVVGKVNRVADTTMSDDERIVNALVAPEFMKPGTVAIRERGEIYDRNNRRVASYYTIFNPFGNWYSPADAFRLAVDPLGTAIEGSIISSELKPDGQGFAKSLANAKDAFDKWMEAEDPEVANHYLLRGLAHLTNTTRIFRYFKPLVTGKGGEAVKERVFRGVWYLRRVSASEILSAMRRTAKMKGRPDIEENIRHLQYELGKYKKTYSFGP
ncbi:hypothetical protein J7L85_01235, partial [candidate division WOR-3 bacterium]|nr:hypothetical protein [candidate division WOR-3 bacterium]